MKPLQSFYVHVWACVGGLGLLCFALVHCIQRENVFITQTHRFFSFLLDRVGHVAKSSARKEEEEEDEEEEEID
jgi:hypothetical protein